MLIPPISPRCCLAPSVTTPLYSTTVSQALRQTLRGEVPKGYPPSSATHEAMGGGIEDVEVGDTSHLTIFSAYDEYTPDTLSEPRGWLLKASATPSNRVMLQEPHRGFSRLVFDLPPNPSIDHLVAVILKYPRQDESGRRKSLNPGPIGKHYTGSWK